MGSKTRVYAVFLSKKKGEQGWPSDDFDPEPRRDHLLRRLEGACENIEFVGGDIIQDFDEVKKVEGRGDIDGVLVYTLTTPLEPKRLGSYESGQMFLLSENTP